MILITGAGGKTGRTLVKTLVKTLSQVEVVYALIHREEDVSVLKTLGAQKAIIGDMRDENVMRSAMQGVRVVYHTAWSDFASIICSLSLSAVFPLDKIEHTF